MTTELAGVRHVSIIQSKASPVRSRAPQTAARILSATVLILVSFARLGAQTTPPRQPVTRVALTSDIPAWTSIGPAGGGNVRSIAIAPSNPSIFIVGTVGYIFQSSDAGATWFPLNELPRNRGGAAPTVNVVAIDPSSPLRLYAAADNAGSSSSGTVYVSADGGNTWAAGTGLPLFSSAHALALDPSVPGTAYAGFDPSGVFKTVDGGASWSVMNTGLLSGAIRGLAIDPVSPLTLYAATAAGVAKTVDGGLTWAAASSGLTYTTMQSLAISVSSPSTLYACGVDASFGHPTVYLSKNGGASWAAANAPTRLGHPETVHLFADPTSPSTVYAVSYYSAYKSTDSAANWSPIQAGLPTLPSYFSSNVAIDRLSPETLYVGASSSDPGAPQDGVYRSTNGGAVWSAATHQPPALQINAPALNPQAPATVVAAFGAMVTGSRDYGNTWQTTVFPNEPQVSVLKFDARSPSAFYAAAGADLFRSADGLTWTQRNAHNPNATVGFYDFAFPSDLPGTIYAVTTGGFAKSTDGGLSWVLSNAGLSSTPFLSVLLADPSVPSILYVAGYSGFFRSTDSGASWTKSTDQNLTVTFSLLADARAPGTVYAGGYFGGVVRSTDYGLSWSNFGAGLPETPASLSLDPAGTGTLYAGTLSHGVWRSSIAHPLWEPVTTALKNRAVHSIAVSSGSPSATIYAGTEESVFRSVLPPDNGLTRPTHVVH